MANTPTREHREAAWLSQYTMAAARESRDEKRGWAEQCYTADQLREAFEDGWDAAIKSIESGAHRGGDDG